MEAIDTTEIFTGYDDTVYITLRVRTASAFDTVEPCDTSWIIKGDTRTVAEFMPPPAVRQALPSQPDINPFLIAFAFALLAYSTAAYVSRCINSNFKNWRCLIEDVNKIIHSNI
jgi:hypothetical protein